KDRARVEREYSRMKIAARHPYLERERCIPPALLGSARFAGRIRIDSHGNAVFPHFDAGGLCGYELKNAGFTGFAKGGEKGLWESHDQDSDAALVFAESAIDALSHAALFPNPHARYRSIGGAVNDRQPRLIRSAIADMVQGSEIICATDNDDAGWKLATMLRDCFEGTGRADLRFTLDLPPKVTEDWNQVLKDASRETSLPSSSSQSRPPPLPSLIGLKSRGPL
ncbi:DUF3991 and TOPRIM domain-containing protein, partial [Bradyrhizobium sp.]|uniref:DUF3991 and TOPRIM domain-containing protein n=1 Tax=Bradyrhizobium sp. TaxID=376 RepID=UPI001ED0A7AE